MFKNKNILITGATGLIGSHLANKLLEEKANLILTGRNIKKLDDVFANNNNIQKIACDITVDLPNNLPELDYIFHAASPISNDDVKNIPVDVIKSNIFGLINCCEFLRNQKEKTGKSGKVIVFSSIAVYGLNSQSTDISLKEEEAYKANSLELINSAYSESKRIIEVIAKSYHKQYNLETVIVRLSCVYGYTKFPPHTPFYEFINNALNDENIVLFNPRIPKRDNIYVEDVVSGLLLIAENGISGESYNLGSNGDEDNFRGMDELAYFVADYINNKLDKNIRVIEPSDKKDRKPGIMLDNYKIKSLGWKVNTNIASGIEKTVQQYIDLVYKKQFSDKISIF